MEKVDKVNKQEFMKYVEEKHKIPAADFERFYDALIDCIVDKLMQGKKVAFTRFGVFYLQKHKGHPVQFEDNGNNINDYVVFKFSASDTLNQKLRKKCVVSQADGSDVISCEQPLFATDSETDESLLKRNEPNVLVSDTKTKTRSAKQKKKTDKKVSEMSFWKKQPCDVNEKVVLA